MKIKILLFALLAMITLPALAQEGGIRGRVVTRYGRYSIDGAKVTLKTPMPRFAETKASGEFEFSGVPAGTYFLLIVTDDFQPVQISVKVDENMVKNVGFVTLVSESEGVGLDDAAFSEFDTESGNDAQSMPVVLSASKDVFDNVAGYKFGAMRFRTRGYETSTSDVYLNGVYMNDALSGYSPWSLWSGLNEATRNQETSTGLAISDYGVGNVNGTTNINARASQMRKGFRASVVNANGQYRFRLMASYASGESQNGWSYALSASTRQGGNDWVNGVYYNSWAYFGSLEKKLNYCNRLSFTFFGSPTERGAQTASTQEVYDMVGSNYYNANWGYQAGDKRNARVRNNHEPVAVLNYFYDPSDKFQLMASVSYRFGTNGYSALDWYDSPDPRPDYYRNLPSYYKDDPEKAGQLLEGWLTDWNVRQINWGNMYNVNRSFVDELDSEATINGMHRSKYVVEERHTDQKDLNAKIQIVSLIHKNSKLSAGAEFRWNRTEYYKKIKDLLGGDYYLDVDQFAERDFGTGDAVINDLNNPYRKVKKGDKYGYDYLANVRNEKLWATYRFNIDKFEGYVAAEGGHTSFWREGLYRKGLFPDNSEGDSKKQNFWTYTGKLGLVYKISGNHMVSANVSYMERAPYFQESFVSPRTRNTVVPNLTTEKIFSADLNYTMRISALRMRLTGFYTQIKDQTKLISFYDDLNRTFTNFAMSGIDQTHTGMELGLSVPISTSLTATGALSYGYYIYSSNPYVTQTRDNSEAIILQNERVYWKDMKVAGTPQTAANIGLNYRSRKNIYAGIDLSYYDAMYLDMNPLYRTDYAHAGLNSEQSQVMARQERFDNAFVLGANVGKSWYIARKYNLGFSLEVKNILNNQNIKTGGYEQMRLKKNGTVPETYSRFDSKYFYMFGTTYYLNIYLRF